MKNTAAIGNKIRVPTESGGKIWGTVIARYRRWALVQTDAGYKTAVWLDQRGRVMT